jgi:sugar lactone lactonase YvrE
MSRTSFLGFRFRRPMSLLAVMALATSFWAGCVGDSPEAPSEGQKCTPGQSAACTGPGGCAGALACGPSGTFDSCTCGGNDAGTDAGVPVGAPGAPSGVAAAPVPVVSTVTTLAGSGSIGADNGQGALATFNNPAGVAVDAGGTVYVGDVVNNRIRRVTPAGLVTTSAGTGANPPANLFLNGPGATATLNYPAGTAVDLRDGTVYIADSSNHAIRKMTAGGDVSTFAGTDTLGWADGPPATARFHFPYGVALDAGGNVYVADGKNNRIRKVTPAGDVTTLAGANEAKLLDGMGDQARFNNPNGVAVDAAGNVYVADSLNNAIRKVTPAGLVSTRAGSGTALLVDDTGAKASFNNPSGVALDLAGNLYVADSGNNRIRRVTPAGVVTTLAGSGSVGGFFDGTGDKAIFNGPQGVAMDATGNLYVADSKNQRIRKVTSVGIGQLAVTWGAPSAEGGSAITGYTASASAPGSTTQTCTTAGPTSCTISGLTSGVAYGVSVTATNAAGTGASAVIATASPN